MLYIIYYKLDFGTELEESATQINQPWLQQMTLHLAYALYSCDLR